jgi:hypothetical protein
VSWNHGLNSLTLDPVLHDHPIGAGKEGNIFFRNNDGELAYLDLTTGIIQNIGVKAEKWRAQKVVIYKKS